ncbi:glycoside hydrolase family protein [Helicobacter pylori]|uniref:glycoside hydrolase family protein n=1 Tax=Helicobacter pylori TaxID=210 RepID=UPI0001F46CD8|nr:lysozyme [Helicobacter pylori]WRC21098.1 lysozyme [Helicobacter pylori]WRF38840.1 lysozyme [Helicobacter pylori]BAJ59465.1 lysozyme-like protein [Helicobacter pylori F57]BAW42697.1 lysozyme-like protein [Helicobacter pylori]BAW65385.1 lysozyme-like protein [Helicobacter pylori]
MLCLSKLILAASFLIVDSEGFSPSIYTDKTGHPTIGYGYNLSVYSYESKRITKPQAYGLLTDILKENHKALLSYGWYKNLDAMRRMVILDLSYNLGLSGLFKFKQFIKGYRG